MHAHPFLDGNGRVIITVHTELAQRAEVGINLMATKKQDYLAALTKHLNDPASGALDQYLYPFIGAPVGYAKLAEHISSTKGLAGGDFFPDVKYVPYAELDVEKHHPKLPFKPN